VVWQRAMERLGYARLARLAPDRERNAWTPANRERVRAERPDRLFVMDLGSQPESVIKGVPTCFIDHHRPGEGGGSGGVAPGDTLITAYGWNPIPNTSLMVYDLYRERVNLDDMDWVAAVGTVSDLGERAPFPLVEAVKKKYTAKYLKEATALVNAARRASRYDPEAAARALLAHDSPRALVNSDDGDAQTLRSARDEVKAEMDRAKQAAPVFAGNVALVRVRSACQVHPLIAQIWRTRLPKYLVVVANDGYMPGRVHFSARSAPGRNALEYLRSLEPLLPPGEGNFGKGHDQASGGSLPPERWQALLRAMGFPEGTEDAP
jgi:single-stranded-DNA-specific exonuclease